MASLIKKVHIKYLVLKYSLLEFYGARNIKKYGLWFIDIPRTSSTSVRVELGKTFGSTFGKRDVFEKKFKQFQVFPNHIPAKTMRETLGKEEWDKIFSFTIVRNPWDRMVSLYHYRLRSKLLRADMEFREYILKLKSSKFGEPGAFYYYGHYYGCADYVLDDNDNIIVSFIAKYETRDDDLKYVAEKIGLPELGKLTLQKASPNKKHYSEYYDEETKTIVEDIYAKDIELFGYKFETK